MIENKNLKLTITNTKRKIRGIKSFQLLFILVFSLLPISTLSTSVHPVYAQSDPQSGQNDTGDKQSHSFTTEDQSTDDNSDDSPEQSNDAYYSSLFAYSWQIPAEEASTSTFWIEVNLSRQMLYAYRGDQIINTFVVSTGAGKTPTVTGTYRIYAKYNTYNMTGPNYEYPDVPYTMFFHKGYSIHGTYWHNFFGTPMSWGCVNMKTEDAAWIYKNAPVGTYIFIHY